MRCLLLIIASCGLTEAFNVGMASPALRAQPLAVSAAAPVMMAKKTKTPTLEERGYWAGEWVCADCGYIYEPDPESPFEELRQRWKCPQCAGPRRRFVKKAGGMLGTLDDSPVVLGTGVAALAIIALVYIGLTS